MSICLRWALVYTLYIGDHRNLVPETRYYQMDLLRACVPMEGIDRHTNYKPVLPCRHLPMSTDDWPGFGPQSSSETKWTIALCSLRDKMMTPSLCLLVEASFPSPSASHSEAPLHQEPLLPSSGPRPLQGLQFSTGWQVSSEVSPWNTESLTSFLTETVNKPMLGNSSPRKHNVSPESPGICRAGEAHEVCQNQRSV